MELVNHTGLDARLYVTDTSSPESGHSRACLAVAKATLVVDSQGQLELDTHTAIPILDTEVETALGSLPRDNTPNRSDELDVLILGAAQAVGGAPTSQIRVTFRIGQQLRTLVVTGDRIWSGDDADARPTEPQSFTRLPMSWDRAFGGSADVWVDGTTVVPLSAPQNPLGLGFDVSSPLENLSRSWKTPEGFPRVEYTRRLPNVEHGDFCIERWDDTPPPACWAPMPPEVCAYLTGASVMADGKSVSDRLKRMSFAHPDLRFTRPDPGSRVELTGCHETGPLSFMFPSLYPTLDYQIDDRSGSLAMIATQMVILAEERRIALTYQSAFRFKCIEDGQRSMRLRVDES